MCAYIQTYIHTYTYTYLIGLALLLRLWVGVLAIEVGFVAHAHLLVELVLVPYERLQHLVQVAQLCGQ